MQSAAWGYLYFERLRVLVHWQYLSAELRSITQQELQIIAASPLAFGKSNSVNYFTQLIS